MLAHQQTGDGWEEDPVYDLVNDCHGERGKRSQTEAQLLFK